MRKHVLLLLTVMSTALHAQDYSVFRQTVQQLYSLAAISDTSARNTQVNSAWNALRERHAIPITQEDSVAFLYRGKATSVAWVGDFNGWGYDKLYSNKGVRIPNTDIWILKTSFPKNARLDYKILINGTDWILDSSNPYQQWSGVGGGSPNSELRMPEWKPDPVTQSQSGVAKGSIISDVLFFSKTLNYQIMFSVYLPNGYDTSKKYPVIYVTDGYEYLHEKMGNMATIIDNLIAQKKIQPIVAVFVDNREPVNRANNRRMTELAMNASYQKFFEIDLIPFVESTYAVVSNSNERAILGTSMGGLTAAYFAFSKPGVFGMSGIQSPAFWFKPEIYSVCDNPENPPVKIYLTTGVVFDAQDGARKMKEIMEKNMCNFQYSETNQGHSWGNWRDTIDDILVYFFPPK